MCVSIDKNRRAGQCASSSWRKRARKGKVYTTRYSQAVTHPSTNLAQPGLTSVIGREPVFSRWYGRRRLMKVEEYRFYRRTFSQCHRVKDWSGRPFPHWPGEGRSPVEIWHVVRQGGREVRGVRGGAGSVSHTVGRGLAEGLGGGWAGLGYRFSAFWLRSSVVSVLISLISDTLLIE